MLLLWLLLMTGFVAIVGISITTLIAVIRRIRKVDERKSDKYWVALPLGCSCAPLLILGSLLGGSWLYQVLQPASSQFEEAFGAEPTDSIKNLQGKVEPGFDSRALYLAFDRSIPAWNEVIGLTANQPSKSSGDLVDSIVFQGGVPAWWHGGSPNFDKKGCERSNTRSFEGVNGWDDLVIIDCMSDGKIYVLAHNID